MPTKTKPSEARRVGELEERLSTLEQQRRQAAEAITLAEQRTEEIAARQQQIAVAVVSEDPEAAAENQRLEEALLIERRRAATARSAGEQLDALIEQARQAIAEAKRREHLEAAAHLARERHALEARAEDQMAALLSTLSELAALDGRQVRELRAGGAEAPTEPFGWTVEPWLLTRLAEWVSENPRHQGYANRALAELDALASEATPSTAWASPGRSAPSNQS